VHFFLLPVSLSYPSLHYHESLSSHVSRAFLLSIHLSLPCNYWTFHGGPEYTVFWVTHQE
jgi:hypothetical protein